MDSLTPSGVTQQVSQVRKGWGKGAGQENRANEKFGAMGTDRKRRLLRFQR